MSEELNEKQDGYVVPGPLYHYTDSRGLLGIIESKKLWATHVRYLNDEREFGYGIELARSIIQDLQDAADDDKAVPSIVLGAFTNQIEKHDSFVASFSLLGDDLNQWRAYSPSGAGFNICLNPSLLDQLKSRSAFKLYPCRYKKEEQKALLSDLCSRAAAQLADDAEETPRQVFVEFTAALLEVATTLKDPAFEAEQEWRLAAAVFGDDLGDVKCRAGQSMLIPYIEIDLASIDGCESPISGVCVGPSAHQELSVQAIKRHLVNNGIHNIEPTKSLIPFRNW